MNEEESEAVKALLAALKSKNPKAFRKELAKVTDDPELAAGVISALLGALSFLGDSIGMTLDRMMEQLG